MKNLSLFVIFILLVSQLSAFTDNPTAPSDYFLKFEGDYTDTDGDGMTDVAEKKYGFDPRDAESRPVDNGYFISEDDHFAVIDSKPTGDANDRMYIRFNRFPEHLENQYKDIIIHLMPILFKKLGNPAMNQVLNIYNKGKVSTSAWTVSSQGRTMMVTEAYNPQMFIHELVHAWKGKYTFTNRKGSTDTGWIHTKATAGFEEGSADGLKIDLIHEFIDCYPNHLMSKFCISSIQQLRTGSTSTFDFLRGDLFMSCGNLWYDPGSLHLRYGTVGDTFRILTTHDEQFMQKALDLYYKRIDDNITYRPTAENLIDVFSDVLPEVNGVETKKFLSNLPWFSSKPIPNQLHIACFENLQGWGGGAPWIYPAFPDAKGKTYQHHVKSEEDREKNGLPTWIKYYKDSRGYYWPDHMNQPFEVRIDTIFGEHIETIHEKTINSYDSAGKPKNLGKHNVKSLTRSNWPIGLYKQTITFTEYAKHTDDAISEKYFFGYENFSQDKQNEFVIMFGVDCEVAEKVLFRLGEYHQISDIVNGCAIFRTNKIPTNSRFIAEFDVFDINGSKRTYKRAVIKTAYTRDMYLQHSYVVIDRNFNGIEDIYEDGEIVSLKNPKHLKYDEIRRNSHPMFLSFNDNLHNNVTVTLQSDGIMLSSKTAKYMYVFDEKDNQLSVSNQSTSQELRRLVEFSRYPKDSISKIKVRTTQVINGKTVKSPMRVFLVQDILDGKLIEEKNYEFVDENFVHNANDLNISSVLGGVQLTWKTFENELPTVVIHNGTHKIADRGANGFVIDYDKFDLNGTEELFAHFKVFDKVSGNLLYITKEFSFKLLEFKTLEQNEEDDLIKRFARLVDENRIPKFNVIVHFNGIELDFNNTGAEFVILNIIDVGRTEEFINYDEFSLEGKETLRIFVEFLANPSGTNESLIVTKDFDLNLSNYFNEYNAKKTAMEEKFAVYVDEDGNTNCTITPQEDGGVLFEWNDAEGLISHLVIFKDGKLVNSKKGGSLLLDFEDTNLNGTETIEIRHAVRTLTGDRVFYSNSTFIDLNEHKFVPETKWKSEFFTFVDEQNNPRIKISKSNKYNSNIRFDWNDTSEFRGVLRVTRGGINGEYLVYGDHSKGFAEINLYNKGVSQRPIAEVALMIYDNLGYGEENYHWESNIISIDLSEYELKPPTDDPEKPPVDDYRETIAVLEEQIDQLIADLNGANQEIYQKDETIAEIQSTNQELAYESAELRGELLEKVEKNEVLTTQVANLTHSKNTLSYDLGVKTEQLEQAVEMAQVPFINGWVYDDDRGWMFTDPDYYPMIYTHRDDTWHCFELGSSDPRYFFNFKSQKWEAWDVLPEKNVSNIASNDNF